MQDGKGILRRPDNVEQKENASRSIALAFVDLASEGHDRPQINHEYKLVSAGDSKLAEIATPSSTHKFLDIDILEFFAGDLPEGVFGGRNEGLLKLRVHTCDPQNIEEKEAVASWVKEFNVRDDQYAPGFLFRGVFRRVIIDEFANLAIDLYEMDGDAREYYDKFSQVIKKVPEMSGLDVAKGIPYLSLATGIFEGVIDVFGKNPDDHIWSDIPLLEIDPIVGGAFLRSGIYVIFERERNGVTIDIEKLTFKNYRLSSSYKKMPAHLLMGIRLREYSSKDRSSN